jgi:hypothetical protein
MNVETTNGAVISIADLKKMTPEQIAKLEPTMRGARIEEFYDTVVIEPDAVNGVIAEGDKASIFRKGMNEKDFYFGQSGIASGEYVKKGYLDTNMEKNGEFQTGEAFLLQEIEVLAEPTGNVKSGGVAANGTINDPAITASAIYDPAVLLQILRNQFYLRLKRNSDVRHQGLLREFPCKYGISGAYGGSVGSFAQNTSFDGVSNRLVEPEIIIGGQDFSVEIEYLGEELDLSTVNQWVRIQVLLRGLYIYEIR